MSNLPTTLKKVLDEHLPFDSSSARAIQRCIALHVGHTSRGKIDPAVLREQCEAANLFDYVPEGYEKNTFGANFTVNMRKDEAYFEGDKDGWKLTNEGKAEAKRIFDKGEAPTKRRTSAPKAEKKASKASKAKPKTKAKKAKTNAKKKAASKTASKKKASTSKKKSTASSSKKKATKSKASKAKPKTADRVSRKAAARRKKRTLEKEQDAQPAAAEAPAQEEQPAATGSSEDRAW